MSQKDKWIGTKKIMNCGMEAEIIDYISANTITVKFSDGTIVKNKRISHFKNGNIGNPNYDKVAKIKQEREGMQVLDANNELATLVLWNNQDNVIVRWEDGEEFTCVWDTFRNRKFKRPSLKKTISAIGERNKTTDGRWMEIIAYRHEKDIDVVFDDGSIGTHKSYTNFKRGQVVPDGERKKQPSEYIGKRIFHPRSKMYFTITNITSSNEIEVTFDDGYIGTGNNLLSILKGTFQRDDFTAFRKERIGLSKKNCQGIEMKITEYKDSRHITVLFEDGNTKIGKWDDFKDGEMAHPTIYKAANRYTGTFKHKGEFVGFIVESAWEENNNIYYRCECKKCGLKDILTPQQMLEHIKIHEISINEPTTKK